MLQMIALAMQIFAYLTENKDAIKTLILNIEGLIPEAAGSSKAQAVRTFIGTAMGQEAQIEAAWPLVAPIFNLFVAHVKPAVPAPVA